MNHAFFVVVRRCAMRKTNFTWTNEHQYKWLLQLHSIREQLQPHVTEPKCPVLTWYFLFVFSGCDNRPHMQDDNDNFEQAKYCRIFIKRVENRALHFAAVSDTHPHKWISHSASISVLLQYYDRFTLVANGVCCTFWEQIGKLAEYIRQRFAMWFNQPKIRSHCTLAIRFSIRRQIIANHDFTSHLISIDAFLCHLLFVTSVKLALLWSFQNFHLQFAALCLCIWYACDTMQFCIRLYGH